MPYPVAGSSGTSEWYLPQPRPAYGTQTERTTLAGLTAADRAVAWLHTLSRLLILLLAFGTIIAGVAAVRGVLANGDWMYSDGVQLYHVLRIRDGFSPYPDFSVAPFLALVYWPLYLGTVGMLARLANLGVEGALYLTRMVAVVGSIGAAASIVGLAAACGARRSASLVGGGLFLTAYVVHPWAYAARADLPSLAFVLAGSLLMMRSRSVTAAGAAGILMAAGFGCKQTFVVGVAATTLALLWRREWLRGVVLVTAWTATVAVIAVSMEMSSSGRFFENTVASNLLPFRFQTLVEHLRLYAPLSLPLLVLAVGGWRGLPNQNLEINLIRLYAVLAAVTDLITLARAGSYYNHLIETTGLLAVLAGCGFERCLRLRDRSRSGAATDRPSLKAILPLVAMMTLAVCGTGMPLMALGFKAAFPPDRSRLINIIRDAPGPVLTEKDALAVILAGKEPIGGDPLGVGLLARQGRWNPEVLNALVRTQAFSLIVLNKASDQASAFDEFDWWPPGTIESIQHSYVLDRRFDGFFVYVPRADIRQEVRP